MVLFNYATRELTAKIVYYGAGLCGKTTNLEHIHKSLPEKARGKMLSLATQTDRTLFFDFLPLDLGSIKGMKTRVQLYTVPGQVFYDATRKLVLKGADAVVFVVDSQKEMLESNLESWENLRQNLKENNLDIDAIPLVVQYNKRDLPNVLPIKDLNNRVNVLKAPFFEAVALTGFGVQETLKGIAKIVMKMLAKKYSKEEVADTEEEIPAIVEEAPKAKEDESFDLSALDEEVKELPHIEELESGEEGHIHLEPVEAEVASGQIEEMQELHDMPEIQEEDLQEVTEVRPEPPPRRPPSPPKKAADPVEALIKEQAFQRPKRSRTLEELPPIPVSLGTSTKKEKPALRTSERETASGIATVTGQDLNVPVEITVSKQGQDVKLQISITLKIKVQD